MKGMVRIRRGYYLRLRAGLRQAANNLGDLRRVNARELTVRTFPCIAVAREGRATVSSLEAPVTGRSVPFMSSSNGAPPLPRLVTLPSPSDVHSSPVPRALGVEHALDALHSRLSSPL